MMLPVQYANWTTTLNTIFLEEPPIQLDSHE